MKQSHMHNPLIRLGELAEIRSGFLSREAVRNDPDGTHCLLQIRDFDRVRSTLNVADMVRISPTTRVSALPLQAGDVLFLAKGANNFAFVISDLPSPTLAASNFFIISPKLGIVSGYIAWFLNHESTRAALSRLATTGAHMPIIRREVLETLEIPLPAPAVQKIIVDLDSLCLQEQVFLSDLAQKQQSLISAVCMKTARNTPANMTLEGKRP